MTVKTMLAQMDEEEFDLWREHISGEPFTFLADDVRSSYLANCAGSKLSLQDAFSWRKEKPKIEFEQAEISDEQQQAQIDRSALVMSSWANLGRKNV